MLFKARLPWREKLELFVLFSGGIFVMAAGILRCVLIVTVSLLPQFYDLAKNAVRPAQTVPPRPAAGPAARRSSPSSSATPP
jgi:hypothetical protein